MKQNSKIYIFILFSIGIFLSCTKDDSSNDEVAPIKFMKTLNSTRINGNSVLLEVILEHQLTDVDLEFGLDSTFSDKTIYKFAVGYDYYNNPIFDNQIKLEHLLLGKTYYIRAVAKLQKPQYSNTITFKTDAPILPPSGTYIVLCYNDSIFYVDPSNSKMKFICHGSNISPDGNIIAHEGAFFNQGIFYDYQIQNLKTDKVLYIFNDIQYPMQIASNGSVIKNGADVTLINNNDTTLIASKYDGNKKAFLFSADETKVLFWSFTGDTELYDINTKEMIKLGWGQGSLNKTNTKYVFSTSGTSMEVPYWTSGDLKICDVKENGVEEAVTILDHAVTYSNVPIFSEDEKSIYFLSVRMKGVLLFSIPITGGTPTQLIDNYFPRKKWIEFKLVKFQ